MALSSSVHWWPLQNLAIVALGVAAAIGWVFVERRAAEPIVPLSLFRNSDV